MEIACNHCQTRFNIPDDKLPKGRKVSLQCPKCKQRIQIIPGEEGIQSVQTSVIPVPNAHQEQSTPVYDAADKPFGILDKNAKTAMICVSYPHAKEVAVKILNSMQYHILNVDNIQTALKSMTYHLFNVIIVDDDFDINRQGYNQIMEYLNALDMMSRRKIVILLISKNMHTMDNMAAFHLSVNQILNYKQVNSMESILQRTILEHDQFYTVYNESLRKIGKLN
ncbi:MAG: zinc-ribbon domain-containing protein [Desulfamplus sp.]|nr:zinc-ribbon domain-containing protein [Desulfamplus sp.]MBF0412506.1 zinc-ribbon domain-containing protein [Desulfamplus sp.]